MICYERDFHDCSSSFDDRIDAEIEVMKLESEDSDLRDFDYGFYRHLDDY